MSTTENIIFPAGHEKKLENSETGPYCSKDGAIVSTGKNGIPHELPLSVQSRTVSALCASPALLKEHSSAAEETFYRSEHGHVRAKYKPQHDEGNTFVDNSLEVGSLQHPRLPSSLMVSLRFDGLPNTLTAGARHG